MENPKRKPILYNGEIYGQPIQKGSGGGPKEMNISYDEARGNLLRDLNTTRAVLREMPKRSRLPNEVVLSMVLQPEFIAKSYYPDSLFDLGATKFGISEIGSRIFKMKSENTGEEEELEKDEDSYSLSKLFFLRATEESLNALENQLNKSTFFQKKSFITDIRKISSLGLLDGEDQILGFSDNWREGRIEAVLHPFEIDRHVAQEHFFSLIKNHGVNPETISFKQYSSGVSFVSFSGDREVLKSLKGYNPLRTAHPLKMRQLPNFSRGTDIAGGPKAPVFTKKSKIVVGVIDGGLHPSNPYVKDYAEAEFSVSGNPLSVYQDHGTMVSGALLYGALNEYGKDDTLPEPPVSVKSFGVLSDTTGQDPELYDVIDAMEKIIPSNPDISVYNLSLGPRGPILDDSISRFTYACDLLSKEHNVLFCIAVGNDGAVPGYDRIQAPSDSVNNLAVGAYTKRNGVLTRAPYSSIGPGREGSKMKPDIVAFGGCDQYPIHLVSNNPGMKTWNMGTSFSSPIVARAAAQLIGESNNVIDALVAKTLITHSAITDSAYSHELGHGSLPDQVNEIVDCRDSSYTLIYRGEIEQGKYAEFPIPWDDTIVKGVTNFKYTATVLTDVDHLSTDDYTSSTVELTFHPNKYKYLFTNTGNKPIDGKSKKTEVVDIIANPERAELLIKEGWTQANFPLSDSPTKQFQTESDLRADLKWDSLDSRNMNKRSNGISNPAFHVHALQRGARKNSSKKVKFAIVLTVTAPKVYADLYNNILQSYDALLPLEMNINAEVQVNS